MSEEDRARRVANAAKLFQAIAPYTSVDSDARIAALHNELIYGIDRALAQNSKHRFQAHEIEVLKDISFQIVYVLDAMTQSRKGFRQALWMEFKTASPMKKIAAIGGVLAFCGGAVLGGLTLYSGITSLKTTSQPALSKQSNMPSSTPSLLQESPKKQ